MTHEQQQWHEAKKRGKHYSSPKFSDALISNQTLPPFDEYDITDDSVLLKTNNQLKFQSFL